MSEAKPFRFKFFLPDARQLDADEIEKLPAEKRKAVEAAGKEGIWLEIKCPDDSCLDSEGRITLTPRQSEDKGIILDLFCPDDSCEIVQSTDLP